jgi:hypothetical protein
LWLVNLTQIYCDPLWGELDVVEWYSSRPGTPQSATHATCNDSTYTSWHHKPSAAALGGRPPSGFHRWAVRKQTKGDTTTLSYLYDDQVYASDTCEQRASAATCTAVLDRGWTAILQTAVFGDATGVFAQPAADEAFPTQELAIRSMWITKL